MNFFGIPSLMLRVIGIDVESLLSRERRDRQLLVSNRKKTMRCTKVEPDSAPPLLFKLRDARKIYADRDGAEVVAFSVKGPSLPIEKGFTAILAPSGSGKTTLLNLIGGMDVPTAGRVYFEGKPMPAKEGVELQKHRAHQISFVFQSLSLITHLSALENVALPLIASGVSRTHALERATEYLELVGLTDQEMHRSPGKLSGGQQQRVAVARAAASNAKVILADEPTGALDAHNARIVMRLFKDLARREGKSVVLVTHNVELARKFADRIICLEADGQYSIEETTHINLDTDECHIRRATPAATGKPGLGWRSCVRYAWSDLRHRWTISAVTVATVAFSVYYLLAIAMLCIRFYDTRDQALRQAQLEKVEAYPEHADAIHLRFTDARTTEMRAWPEVRVLFPSVEIYANVSLAHDKHHLLVLSSTVPGDPQTSAGLLWGKGIEDGREQVVISKAVLTRLGGRLTASGPEPRSLTLELQRKVNAKEQVERRSLPIVGIAKHDSRDRVFVPLPLARLVDNWSKGLLADLDGRLHKEAENLTMPFAIAYGPANEEARAIQELGEQRLEVKKLGVVSIVDFSGTAWTYYDGSDKVLVGAVIKQPGIKVQQAYRAKIGSQTWIAWDKDDPRWQQVNSPERDELGWVGTERPAEVPPLTHEHSIPTGLVPPGAWLTNAKTLRWLHFDVSRSRVAKGALHAGLIVEKSCSKVRVISHSASGLRVNIDHHQLACSVNGTDLGVGDLRLAGCDARLFEIKPLDGLPPDLVIVHDDVLRQLAFVTEDTGIMPDAVERLTAIGVEQPILLSGVEELAKKQKNPLTWLTPIQRRAQNKYEVKEKDLPMKQETIRWLTSMKPAVEFAEPLATLKARVGGETWTLLGAEPRSPRAFEANLRAGQWLDGKDALQFVIAAEVAHQHRAGVGDAITIHILRNEAKGEHAISIRLRVIGISGDAQSYVTSALSRDIALWRSRVLEFNEAKQLFESPLEAAKDLGDHRLVLFARSEADVKSLVQKLRERGYRTEDRLHEMESLRQLSLVLTAFASFFVFGFLFMSLVTVMVTTRMHVQAKTFEIGILRSIGLSASNVLRIFVVQGTFIGAAGFLAAVLLFALTGNGLRSGVAYLFSIHDPVFTGGNPFAGGQGIMLYLVALAGLLTVIQSCFGVLAGCWFACRMKPSDALRRVDQ